ncbi:uncharacterized protein LOC143227908 [Tachypleus tridentatus]|uniref:uncharacterized protein LOC143227908 n=1 Tax=Tachypleus tridentatus TaxID=6853 RepID=UPI003FCF2A67
MIDKPEAKRETVQMIGEPEVKRETGQMTDEPEYVLKVHILNIFICLNFRPVIYIPARNHNVNQRHIDELTRFIVYILEQACKKCFEEVIDNLCIIFDLKDFGMNSMDYQLVKNLIWLLSRHYPERLGVCLIINAPAIFSGCWSIIKGWLHEVTASKVVFVNTEQDLLKYIHPDILPENV